MPNATINAVTFTGNVYSDPATVRRAPKLITPKPRKIGKAMVAASGARTWVHRTEKVDQLLEWENVAELTRAAVRAVFALTTTFSATMPTGTATYQCEDEDYTEDEAFCMPDGTRYYNVTLLLRQT
jgi:hypothetical protein